MQDNPFDPDYEKMFNEESEVAKSTFNPMTLADQEYNEALQFEQQLPMEQGPSLDLTPEPTPEVVQQEVKPLTKEDLLQQYRNLKSAQGSYQDDLSHLAMLQGANQIAQGFARGYGADIGDGSKGIEALKGAAKEKVDAVGRSLDTAAGTMKAQQQLMDLGQSEIMADPLSDVSKLYREQAYALLKRMNPESPLIGKLDDMSASQLEKLGFKFAQPTTIQPFSPSDRILPDGTPVALDKRTGQYVNALTGQPVGPGQSLARDVARRDAMTGQYGLMYGGQMNVKPTNYSGAMPATQQTVTPEGKVEQTSKEIPYSELMKVAPAQDKEITDIKKRMGADMKESRDVATSVTNLASKLQPGPNGVDSGLLGGIQTQAAKMAGQKGVLTDQDLVKFAGAGGVPAKIERIIDGSLFGEMSDDDIKFFKRFSQLMGKSLDQDIENRAQIYISEAQQRADTIFPGIQEDNIRKWLGVDKIAPAVQNKPKAAGSSQITSNNVRMQLPNGKIVDIPKENVEKAKSRGAVEVK